METCGSSSSLVSSIQFSRLNQNFDKSVDPGLQRRHSDLCPKQGCFGQMFRSIQEGVRSLWSASSNDKKHPTGRKRKHSLNEDIEDDDPDVQIIKVEKKRRVDTHNSFWNIVHLPSKMAHWVRLKSRMFADQFDTIDPSRKPDHREPLPKRNGVPSRTIHRSRGRPDAMIPQPRSGYSVVGTGHDISKEGRMMNDVNTPHLNGERRSSTSSIFRHGQNYSAGVSSIRLKEREEYEKLLKLQSRLSSPPRTVSTNEPDGSISSSRYNDVSILGTKNIFSSSSQSSNTLIHTPRFKPTPNISHAPSRPSDKSEQCQKFQPDELLRSTMSSVIAHQKRRTGMGLSSQSQVQSYEPVRQSVDSRRSTVDSKSSHSKDSVVVIDDDEDEVVEADKGTKSSDIIQSSTTDATNNGVTSTCQHKSLDFRDSVYMKPQFMEKFQSRLMRCEQWRRQVEEEQNKAKGYEEKRRAQNLALEKKLKCQMRIFEEEPEVSEEIFIEDEEEEEEEVLPELTETMMKIVRSALGPGPPGEILSDAFRLQITRKDIATLAGLNWLNDEVMNFYMNMLMERGEQEGRAKVYAFNTFFYPKIMQGGHGAVKRWTKKVDIFAMHYIIIPVHLGMHWCLCVADIQNKKITYYDSMHGRNKDCVSAVLKYINDESVAKKQQPINMSEWTLEMAEDNPQQLNGSDCGMFSCKYAEYITRGKELTFTQEDMPYFRQRMVYEIITKKLLQ